ncbi:MAG: BNR-4 repeat-containing protein [Actinomycetota bacterium]
MRVRLIDRTLTILAAVILLAIPGSFIVAVLVDDTPGLRDVDRRNCRAFIQDNLWPGSTSDYAVWTDDEAQPVVGRRDLASGDWEIVELGGLEGNPLDGPVPDDLHNVWAIAEGPDGRVHVVGNAHATPLRYARTVGDDFTTWEGGELDLVTERVTYPRFLASDDELLLVHRDGVSQRSRSLLSVMDADGGWRFRGVIIDALPDEDGVYLSRVMVDRATGALSAFTTWRTERDNQFSEGIGYIWSTDDGRTWSAPGGTLGGSADRQLAQVIDEDLVGFVINHGGATLDLAGEPHMVLRSRDDRDLIVHVWRDGGTWTHEMLALGLTGRPGMATGPDGTVWVLGIAGGNLVAVDARDPDRRIERAAGLPSNCDVSIDSRSMEHDGLVRMLVVDGATPSIVSIQLP